MVYYGLLYHSSLLSPSPTSTTNQETLSFPQVDTTVIHPDYQIGASGANHDIALIKLQYPVKLTSHVGFICLPATSSSDPLEGSLCTVTGWGHQMHGAGVSPDLLHSAQVPVVSRRWVQNYSRFSSCPLSIRLLCKP